MIDWQNVDLDAPYVSPTARPFQVGDRVRVRLSPECREEFYQDGGYLDGHLAWEDGLIGTISELEAPGRYTHPYVVFFEPAAIIEGDAWESCVYAASELELLDGAQ